MGSSACLRPQNRPEFASLQQGAQLHQARVLLGKVFQEAQSESPSPHASNGKTTQPPTKAARRHRETAATRLSSGLRAKATASAPVRVPLAGATE